MSDTSSRLAAASAAWTRLFQNTRPIIQPRSNDTNKTRQPQHNKNNNKQRPNQNNTGEQQHATRYSNSNNNSNFPTITLVQESNNAMKKNTTWGDTLDKKSTETTRIYSQNVNGIRLEKDGGQFRELCAIHQEIQADILCIQEHNLDTTQYQVQQIIHQTTRKHWQRSRLNMASSPMTFSNTWKPGGTAILSTGSITGRITASGTDEWGRWSYQTFQGQNQRLFTVINIYQVVDKFSNDKGAYTAYAQQRNLLIRQGDTHLTPRQAFI